MGATGQKFYLLNFTTSPSSWLKSGIAPSFLAGKQEEQEVRKANRLIDTTKRHKVRVCHAERSDSVVEASGHSVLRRVVKAAILYLPGFSTRLSLFHILKLSSCFPLPLSSC